MAPGKRLFCLIAAVALAVFCATTPSDAAREIIAHGDVHLGACNGATAAYVMITPAEDADGLGLGFNDMAASLKNLGEGESGVSFVPDYSELTSNQKSAAQFSVASIFIKGDANALNTATVVLCFSDGTSKTVLLKNLKIANEHLGWKKVQFGPNSLGIQDKDAARLDRLSVVLPGEGNLEVGNVETFFEINNPAGKQLFFGFNLYSNLLTELGDCSLLNSCALK
ncbi:MAG TPA: hypothetical protein V6C89_12180 [Drouetiella sp.]